MHKVVCRPGGTNAEDADDPGIKIPARAKENVKLAVYYIKHQFRVSHAVSVPDIDLTAIHKLARHSVEMSHLIPMLPLQLNLIIGQRLLSLWKRRKLVPKESASDPVTNYFTFNEEMVAHAPIIVADATDEGDPYADAFIAD